MNRLYHHSPGMLSIFFGLLISWIFSHPSSPAKKRIPVKSAKSVHYFPNLKIQRETHYYHLHHWMYLTVLLFVFLLVRKSFGGKRVIQGFILGLILQGLTYPDRFKVKFTSLATT